MKARRQIGPRCCLSTPGATALVTPQRPVSLGAGTALHAPSTAIADGVGIGSVGWISVFPIWSAWVACASKVARRSDRSTLRRRADRLNASGHRGASSKFARTGTKPEGQAHDRDRRQCGSRSSAHHLGNPTAPRRAHRRHYSARPRRPQLLVEPDIFQTPAVEQAVDHQRQSFDVGLPAGTAFRIEDDRAGAVFGKLSLDRPD